MGMCSKKAFTILNTRQHALDKNNCKENGLIMISLIIIGK